MAEREALRAKQETVARLQEQLKQLDENEQEVTGDMVPCPKGTAGADWSIQEAMGLAGSEKKHGIYRALVVSINHNIVPSYPHLSKQRQIRDLTLNAHIKWDSKWADIPASDKAKLFQVVHRHESFKSC